MQLSGTYTFNADQQTVWKLLMDPQAIAKALPNAQSMTPIEGETDAWRVIVKLNLPVINGAFNGIIRMSEQVEPDHYRLTVSGEGQQSVIGGTALITLAPDAGGAKTLLKWVADANISGKLAGIGQRLAGSVAPMMANQFFNGMAKQLPARP